jgi:nucleotide-binding universal stress UspA family protein
MQPQILVGIDFSPISKKALAWAADLQRTLQGKPLQIVYVLNPLPGISAPETTSMAVVSEAEIAEMRVSLADLARKAGCTATVEVILSPAPGQAIVEAATRLASDLIVLGTHGRGALSRMFVGSVAEYVLRHAAIPVLTVREQPAALVSAEAA